MVTNDFPPRRGGIETYVRQWCAAFPEGGVVVYTARMAGDAEVDAALPFPVVRDPRGTLLPTPGLARRVERALAGHDCDRIVYGASAPLGLLAPRLRRAGVLHQTALTHGHEVWWARLPVSRALLRRIGDAVDDMTAVSEYCRDRIAPALSAEAATRLRVVPPTVDRDRFRPGCGGSRMRRRHGIAESAPVVVCLGRLVRRKGQDTLVRIWPAVRDRFPGAVLLIVGDGPDRSRLERMVARRGLRDCVVFAGLVAEEEVPAYLDAGDVFAMPSRSRLAGLQVEGFGIVYLEAAACGLLVVGGRSGGATEAVRMARRLRAQVLGEA